MYYIINADPTEIAGRIFFLASKRGVESLAKPFLSSTAFGPGSDNNLSIYQIDLGMLAVAGILHRSTTKRMKRKGSTSCH